MNSNNYAARLRHAIDTLDKFPDDCPSTRRKDCAEALAELMRVAPIAADQLDELTRLRQRVEELERQKRLACKVADNLGQRLQERNEQINRLTTERDEAREVLAKVRKKWIEGIGELDTPWRMEMGVLLNDPDALTRHADGRKEKTDDTGL